jgi:hypothetical protein
MLVALDCWCRIRLTKRSVRSDHHAKNSRQMLLIVGQRVRDNLARK